MVSGDILSGGNRREELDKIWQYLCDLPQIDQGNVDNRNNVQQMNERLKLIETIIKRKREEEVREFGSFDKISNLPITDQLYYDEDDDVNIPDPILIVKSRNLNKKTILNVGGERHEVSWRTLQSAPTPDLEDLPELSVMNPSWSVWICTAWWTTSSSLTDIRDHFWPFSTSTELADSMWQTRCA